LASGETTVPTVRNASKIEVLFLEEPWMPIIATRAPWYAFYVRSRHEKVAEQSLQGKGYAAFSPFYRVRRKRSDRTKVVDLPLFPGYVFCRFDPENRLPILMTPGVMFVVGSGNTPEPVADSEISSIQTASESGKPLQPWPFLQSGQKVRILAGPLCGVEGTLLERKDSCRMIVSVTLLQRSLAVDIDGDSVEPSS
jgi:transcription antitermination factor NusG